MPMQTPRTKAGLVALATLAVALTGCEALRDDAVSRLDKPSVAERYPISAELQRASLDVSGFKGNGPQSSAAYFDTLRFVRTFAQDGRGPLHVFAPSHGAARDLIMVKRVIQATGLASGQVRHLRRHDGITAVTLSYDRVAALHPDTCYDQSPLTERRPEIDSGTAFGCASQRNLAKMVADPTDLVVAAPEPDRGSDRRAALHKDYRTKLNEAKQ
jgi:pilus assembly protein CpaD